MLFLSLLHEVPLVPGGTLVTFTPDIFKRISGWPENFSTIFPLVERGTLTVVCLLLELDNTGTLYRILSEAHSPRSFCPHSHIIQMDSLVGRCYLVM